MSIDLSDTGGSKEPSDVVGGRLDEWKNLYSMPEVASRESLAANLGWIVARTELSPLRIAREKEGFIEFVPPQAVLREQVGFLETSVVTSLYHSAERIRDYLAYSTEAPIPISYVFATKRLLFPSAFHVDQYRYWPVQYVSSPEKFEEWFRELRVAFSRTSLLLASFRDDSPVGKAIALWGETRWAPDAEDAFLYGWKSLDVMAKGDFAQARERFHSGSREALQPYLNEIAVDVAAGKPTRVSDFVKVCVTVARRAPGTDRALLRKWNNLRSVMSHDFPTPDQSTDILTAAGDLFKVARTVIEDAVPKTRGNST